MLFPSWKTVFKQSRQFLDTSSTPDHLSSFSPSSYRNLDSFSIARWIDRDFFWIFDSFSTVDGSIELPLAFCWFVPRQILENFICRRFVFSTPGSMDVSTPLFVELYWTSIYRFCAIRFLFLSISLLIALSPHLPNHSLSLQTSFLSDFQAFSRFSLPLVSFFSLIYMHFMS